MAGASDNGTALQMVYRDIEPVDWESWRILGLGLDGWLFRGQEDATWPLESTFEREASHHGLDRSLYPDRERAILYEFKRRARLYTGNAPNEDHAAEWLALLRHYGGPTRLLDFTYSLYVATFFAVERARGAAAVWAVNIKQLTDRAMPLFREHIRELGVERGRSIYDTVLREAHTFRQPAAMALEPWQMNERLAAQQGLFIMPFSLRDPFEVNLFGTFGATREELRGVPTVPFDAHQYDIAWATPEGALGPATTSGKGRSPLRWVWPPTRIPILKIVLPDRLRDQALRDLRRMNVTAASLFPDLDGFARSLSYHLVP